MFTLPHHPDWLGLLPALLKKCQGERGSKRLIGDHAPPHHAQRVLAAAQAAPIPLAWLPFRSPELPPREDRWRLLTAFVAANRVDDTVDTLARHAVD